MSQRLVVTDEGIGRLEDDRVALLDTPYRDLGEALEAGVSLEEVWARPARGDVALADAHLVAPVARPRQIWAVGLNYRAHVDEIQGMDLTTPFIFLKAASGIVGPGEAIVLPEVDGDQVDFEGEMALVVGRRIDAGTTGDLLDAVAGITLLNDVSARSLQKGGPGTRPNISLAKSFSTFAPLGPAVALTSSVESLDSLKLMTWVNGELRQSASTEQLIFPLRELLAYLAARVTLLPGDIIATGTPEGVGDVDGRYLAAGDSVRISLDEVGELVNPVVAR